MAASIAFWMTLRAASLEEICIFGNWFGRIVHANEGFFELGCSSWKKDGKVRGTQETCNKWASQILSRLKQLPQL